MCSGWQSLLNQWMKTHKQPRLAVVGIGHELCGDDAAGVLVARALQPVLAAKQDILVLDAGHMPENATSTLRRFAPDLVLMVDAAQLGEQPGAVHWLPWRQTSGLSASTHTVPIHLIAQYLNAELGCDVALLGIQPARVDFDTELTPEVRNTIASIVQTLADMLAVPSSSHEYQNPPQLRKMMPL